MNRANGYSLTAAVLILLVLLLTAPVCTAVTPSEIVARHGIRPVDPPTPASDFRLPSLDGKQVALSDLHGSWVLLTFFATWCGPCRSEMPSLERLNQQLLDDGFVVLAISTDSRQQAVGPFVEGLGLTFPVLWDAGGKVAATYRASSIPLSYLVDPAGRLVGVSRGARDWAATASMLEELLASIPPDSDTDFAYQAADGPVSLPSSVEPPTAEIALLSTSPVAGKVFDLEVKLLWSGRFEEYLPQPPQVHLPEGVERRQVTASTSSRDGSNVVTYRLQLVAAEPGTYALDPVELRYLTREEAQPLTSRLLGPTVTVKARTIAGLSPRNLGLVLGGLILVGGLGLVVARLRRSRRQPTAGSSEQPYNELRALFDQVKAQRLQGDIAGSVQTLAELDRRLSGSSSEPLPARLQELLEQARYGGQAPASEELEQWQRRVERQLEALRPDPEEAERDGIRLAEPGDDHNPNEH